MPFLLTFRYYCSGSLRSLPNDTPSRKVIRRWMQRFHFCSQSFFHYQEQPLLIPNRLMDSSKLNCNCAPLSVQMAEPHRLCNSDVIYLVQSLLDIPCLILLYSLINVHVSPSNLKCHCVFLVVLL